MAFIACFQISCIYWTSYQDPYETDLNTHNITNKIVSSMKKLHPVLFNPLEFYLTSKNSNAGQLLSIIEKMSFQYEI